MEFYTFCFVCYCITNIVILSSLFDPFREKGPLTDFFRCFMCVGFWVGAILSIYQFFFPLSLFPTITLFEIPFYAFIGSGSAWLFASLIEFLNPGD